MDFPNDRDHSSDRQGQNHNHCENQPKMSSVSDVFCEVALNQEDHSYMYDEDATPSKACEGSAFHNACGTDNANKEESEEQRETRSASKRRRLLFDYQDSDSYLCSGEHLSALMDSNDGKDPFDGFLPYGSQIIPGFPGSDNAPASSFEGLGLSASEEWISYPNIVSECLNNPEMQLNETDLTSKDDEFQIDLSDILNVLDKTEANVVSELPTRASSKFIIKGLRSSDASVPSKLPSSIVYPFAFIKPCGFRGDITLQDINQKIQTPPSKPKQTGEDPRVYHTSTFSGKPVVVKTKIQTQGGKGSITIMRTKG